MAKEGEVVPPELQVSIVQSAAEFDYRTLEFRNLEATALADLRRTQHRLRFLHNQRAEMKTGRRLTTVPSTAEGSSSNVTETLAAVCQICKEEITETRPVC